MSVKNQLATKAENQISQTKETPKNMKQWIIAMEGEIAKALPTVITPERFTRMAMTAISSNPKLAASTPQSFMGALMNAAQLGLEPNTALGQAYLIPFKNNKAGTMEVQFQIGYKGMIDLAHRSGEFKTIYAKEVYENDDFSFEFGLEPKLFHKPSTGSDRGKVIFYYAVFTLVNGGFGFDVMTPEDIRAHAKKFSMAYNSGPWQTNFDAMAKKTLIKQVLKYAPIKTEFVRQINQDATIKTELSSDMSEVDSVNIYEADYEEVEAETVNIETGEILDDDMPEFLTEKADNIESMESEA